MEQKLILVSASNFEQKLNNFFAEGWHVAQISAPGINVLHAECWVLLERVRNYESK